MTQPAPQKKLIPWESGSSKGTLICRVYCPKCGKSKVIEGYANDFWLAANVGMKTTNCDSCRGFISYRVMKDGVEV